MEEITSEGNAQELAHILSEDTGHPWVVHRFGRERDEVVEGVVGRRGLRNLVVRLGLHRVAAGHPGPR